MIFGVAESSIMSPIQCWTLLVFTVVGIGAMFAVYLVIDMGWWK